MSRIAIIGTGIAGLGAAHFLHRHHALILFEANNHVGGHLHLADAVKTDSLPSIDTGFTVYNEDNSPLLTRLFADLKVPIKKAVMSLSVRDDLTGIEWCGASLNRLFAQRKNLLSFRFLKLLSAINRFNKEAAVAFDDPAVSGMTLADYVRQRGYGEDFFNLHLVPMSTTVWNASPESMLSFPAATLLRFFHSHGLLGIRPRQHWLTVDGGSLEYRDRLIAPFRGSIQLERPVVRVIRNGPSRGVTVMTTDGATHVFDKVIIATHADQALRLLVNPTPDEARLLRAFKYETAVATLHTDASVLPRTPAARASRNYRFTRAPDGRIRSSMHYWLNELHGAPDGENHFVSINRPDAIDPAKVVRQIDTTHPVFSLDSIRAQTELPHLNEQAGGRTETYFAGGYFRHGLHEDAFMSAVRLSELLLGRDPWTPGSDG